MSSRSLKLEALSELIERDGADPKPTMLRVLTDFYVQKTLHTPEEDRHFTELALRLIGDVDRATCADVARRLTEHGGAPAVVLRRLNEAEAPAPEAPRPSVLHVTQAEPVMGAPRAAPAQAAVSATDRAAATEFTTAFFASDSGRRRAMLHELDGGAVKLPSLAPRLAASACRELESAALRSRPFEFVREMERALGIPRAVAQQIVNDSSGEPILVVAKALDMPIAVLQRILLLVNPAIGTSVRRVFELTEAYHAISEQSALRLIALWRYADMADGLRAAAPREIAGARRATPEMPRLQGGSAPGEASRRDQRAS